MLATRGDAAAPDDTARLVPPDALLYAHLSTSDSRTQDARLLALAGRFSAVRSRVPALAMALTPAAGGLDYARDVRPWLGDEVAVALLDGGTAGPEPLLLAAVDDRSAAERTLARLGARPAGRHAGTPLLSLPPRATAAFTGDHLVIGPAGAVSGAIDRDADDSGTPSLADGRVFRRAAESRKGAASLDLFATTFGLRRLLDGQAGAAGTAGRLLLSPRLEGVSAQVSAEEEGLRATARVLRVPGGPRAAAFAPTLADRVPRDAAGFLAVPGVDALAPDRRARRRRLGAGGPRGRAAGRGRHRAGGPDRPARRRGGADGDRRRGRAGVHPRRPHARPGVDAGVAGTAAGARVGAAGRRPVRAEGAARHGRLHPAA